MGHINQKSRIYVQRNIDLVACPGRHIAHLCIQRLAFRPCFQRTVDNRTDILAWPDKQLRIVCIDNQRITGFNLVENALDPAQDRNIKRTSNNRHVRGVRSFFKGKATQTRMIVIQKFRRANITRHQNDIVGQLAKGRGLILPRKMLQQPVCQIFKIMQAFAQIRIADLGHAGTGIVMHLLNRGFGCQAGMDRLGNAVQPAGILRNHFIGFEDITRIIIAAIAVHSRNGFKHLVEVILKPAHGISKPGQFFVRVVRHHPVDDDARFMQNRNALANPRCQTRPAQTQWQKRNPVSRDQFFTADQLATGDHFGQNHGNVFKRFLLVLGIKAFGPVLHGKHTDDTATAQDRHTDHGMIDFLAGFRTIGKIRMALRIFKIKRSRMCCHITHNPLANPKTGHVDRRRGQTTGREKFQNLARPHHIDRTHLCHHIGGNDGHNLPKAFFCRPRTSHDVADAL